MKKEIKTLLICLFIYLVLIVLSFTIFKEYYVFEWTTHWHHYYLYNWIIVLFAIFKRNNIVAIGVSISNFLGVFIGQFLGDYRYNLNKALITSNTAPNHLIHLGVFIWIFVWVLGLLISLILSHKKNNANKINDV